MPDPLRAGSGVGVMCSLLGDTLLFSGGDGGTLFFSLVSIRLGEPRHQ